jgi:hypothetical protein
VTNQHPDPWGRQPQQHHQQPHWQQPPTPPPPKKRHTGIIVLAILCTFGLLFTGCMAMLATDPSTTPTGGGAAAVDQPAAESGKQPATKPAAAPAAKIGTAVRDGQFEFTVRKVDCTKRQIGGEYGQTAQGVFCLISTRVANIGDEPRTFSDSSQFAYDAKGRKFEADTGAAIYLDDANSFLEDINPGNSVDGILVFDVPKGTKLAKLELHDSAFSGGVEVALKK